jgi:hypothetical protein
MHAVAGYLEGHADRLLRSDRPAVGVGGALIAAGVFGFVYGLAMGTFSGVWDGRTLQLLY